MAIYSRCGFLAVLAGAVAFQAGCGDFGSMAYFLMPEQRIDAKLRHLAGKKDDKKTPRVVILAWSGLETRPQLIHADRQLSDLLAEHLRQLAEAFEEKLTIVPARKVEEFKKHQKGRAKELEREGQALADKGMAATDELLPTETKLTPEQQEYNWNARIFQERQQNLTMACEIPVLIEQRAYEIARLIRGQMKS